MKPEPAAGLSEEARQKWLEMQSEYQITDSQGILLLNLMFEAWDQIEEAKKKLTLEGLIIENESTGYKRAHPATVVLKEARQTFLKSLAMLNLDVEESGPMGRPPGR